MVDSKTIKVRLEEIDNLKRIMNDPNKLKGKKLTDAEIPDTLRKMNKLTGIQHDVYRVSIDGHIWYMNCVVEH